MTSGRPADKVVDSREENTTPFVGELSPISPKSLVSVTSLDTDVLEGILQDSFAILKDLEQVSKKYSLFTCLVLHTEALRLCYDASAYSSYGWVYISNDADGNCQVQPWEAKSSAADLGQCKVCDRKTIRRRHTKRYSAAQRHHYPTTQVRWKVMRSQMREVYR